MAGSNGYKNKRKHPRFCMDWPLEYRVMNRSPAYGGLVVDGSEVGLRIRSVKNLSVGSRLRIAVMFPKGFRITNFNVSAEIVWKDLYYEEEQNGYQYGLKFIHINKEDLQKLKQLLGKQIQM